MNPTYTRSVALWLDSLCLLVFSMVLLGGLTRLTGSGLSMVEWKPLVGSIPPLTAEDWREVFHKYQQFPEYQITHTQMTLAAFKSIFYWEYFHRLLGRILGVAFLFPFLYFLIKKAFSTRWALKIFVGFILGGLQGVLGWYMVQSGLVKLPAVSHYRLTAHLSLAFLIFGYLFWLRMDLKEKPKKVHSKYKYAVLWSTLIFLQIMFGALVAGRHAGHGFNTFPLMNGQFIPTGLLSMAPAWINFFENNMTLQWTHRALALLLTISTLTLFLSLWKTKSLHRLIILTLSVFILQISLGITTLLLNVPITWASLHQAGAFLLFGASLLLCHTLSHQTPIHPKNTKAIPQ